MRLHLLDSDFLCEPEGLLKQHFMMVVSYSSPTKQVKGKPFGVCLHFHRPREVASHQADKRETCRSRIESEHLNRSASLSEYSRCTFLPCRRCTKGPEIYPWFLICLSCYFLIAFYLKRCFESFML